MRRVKVGDAICSDEARRLLETTSGVLDLAIDLMGKRSRWSDVATEMATYVRDRGFSVVENFVGHGIGRKMHEDPQIPNFGRAKEGPKLKPGMTLAIEPMANGGTYEVQVLSDGWTVVSADGQPSAHFEHTVLITETEAEILTWPKKKQLK